MAWELWSLFFVCLESIGYTFFSLNMFLGCFWVEGVFLKKKQWGDLDSHSFGLNVVSLENEMSVALGGKN